LNPKGTDSGISFFKIQHVKTGLFLDSGDDGKTFLALENTNKSLIASQTWKWGGVVVYTTFTHQETGKVLDIGTGSTICTRNKTLPLVPSQKWSQLPKNNPKKIQNNATGLYLDADDQAKLLASSSDKLKNPDWDLVNGLS
jgi:hypothetical protein